MIRRSPASSTASGAGLKAIVPSGFLMATMMMPSSLRMGLAFTERPTRALPARTSTSSICSSRWPVRVASSMKSIAFGRSTACATRCPPML